MKQFGQRFEFSGKSAWLKIFQLLSVMCIALHPFISAPAVATSREVADESAFLVRADDNLLTVKLRDVPLEEVLTEIANQTGIQITFYGPAGQVLSADFSDIPLDRCLSRLTRGFDHIFIYRGEGIECSNAQIREAIIHCKAGGRRRVIGLQKRPAQEAKKLSQDSLLKGLQTKKDPRVREESANMPMKSKSVRSVVHLSQGLLDNEEIGMGKYPHRVLRDLANGEAPYPAIRAQPDEEADVAESTLDALAQIETEDTIFPSVDALRQEREDRGLMKSDQIGHTLAYLRKGFSVLTATCRTITEGDLADLQNLNDAVRKEAIQKFSRRESFPINLVGRFLNRTIEKKACTIMVELLRSGKESEDIQLNILKAMGELGKRVEVPVSPLIEKLRNEDSRIRLQAVESLGKIKDKKAVPALIQLLETEKNKYPIIWALGEIGDKSAVPALNRLLTSQDKYIRYNTNKALMRIR